MKRALAGACLIASIVASGSAHAEAPRVLVSIAPIHSLVSAVMDGLGNPDLLVPGSASDHDYALKPSDLRKIAGADLVVWMGASLESYLVKPVATEGVANLELLDSPGVEPRPLEGSAEHAGEAEPAHAEAGGSPGSRNAVDSAENREEQDQGGGHSHEHAGIDPHVWLDPVRARAIVDAITARLAEMDPKNAHYYRQNAARASVELTKLDAEIRARLSLLSNKPFITFHEGYSYFVERYGLRQVGRLTIDPDRRPGASTVRAFRNRIAEEGAGCAFAEPQFDRAIIDNLAGETGLKVGILDALGANLAPGPALYGSLMRQNAAAVESCLSTTS